MAERPQHKYELKSLHSEIGLLDRKLAHLLRFEAFASDADRDAAARRINVKREQMVRAARAMAQNGIEFTESDLPLSLRNESAPVAETVEQPVAVKKQRSRLKSSPIAAAAMNSGFASEKRRKAAAQA
jgi:hypothetical protein